MTLYDEYLLVIGTVEFSLALLKQLIQAGCAKGVTALGQESGDQAAHVGVLLLAKAASQLFKRLHFLFDNNNIVVLFSSD